VLERLPGAEVGGERECPDELGRADRLLNETTAWLGRGARRFQLYIPIAWYPLST
jgi:hypothetical protein